MSHIFISYRREDGDFAARLKDKIEAAEFSTWMDLGLAAGQDWGDEIDRAIRSSSALVVILTPEAKESDYVTYEWSFAFGVGVKVVPIVLRPTALHPRLERLHCLDFTNLVTRPWDELIRALRESTSNINTSVAHAVTTVPSFIEKAIRSLDDIDPLERGNAIETLSQTDHPAAREALVAALQHPFKDVRIKAAMGLSEFKDERSMHGLVEGIRDSDRNTREESIRALLKLTASLAGPGLGDVLNNPKSPLRQAASRWLGKFKPESIANSHSNILQEGISSTEAKQLHEGEANQGEKIE